MRRLFEVNSEPHTGARPSVRLCVGLIKGHLGRTSVEPGRAKSHKDSRLHGRFRYGQWITELKIRQEGVGALGQSWERGGPSEGPFVNCQLEAYVTSSLEVPLLANFATMTRRTYTGL